MKIVYSAAFNPESTNYSQGRELANLCDLVRFNVHEMASKLGQYGKDSELIKIVEQEKPDLLLIAKGSNVDIRVVHECNKITKTCLWFMDAFIPGHWNSILIDKIKYCSFTCCDKPQAVTEGLKYNKNVYYVCEGFDHLVDKPFDLEQDINVSFIGGIYGERGRLLPKDCQVFTSSYGEEHAKIVSRSKINLNFCTTACASDRVYKVMSAKGFLITNDWVGGQFIDQQDLIIFRDKQDLDNKIKYYLANKDLRDKIREQGYQSVQKYSRVNWAQNIIDIYNNLEK